MFKRRMINGILAGLGVVTLVLFQNCGEGFDATKFPAEHSTKPDTYLSSVSAQLEPGQNVAVSLTAADLTGNETYLWSHKLNGLAGGCTEQNGNQSATYIVNCASNGDLTVDLVLTADGKSKVIEPMVIGIAAPPQPLPMGNEIQMTLEFEIPPGTGISAWNTSVAPVETFIGQVLRIRNGDSFGHQLKTNGRPCVSTQEIDPGNYGNCLVKHSYSRVTNGPIYDAGAGPSAPFYAVAYDGIQLYSQNCSSCHGALNASAKTGAKPSQILNGRAMQPAMQIPAIMALTQRQIEAISYALGGR